MRTFLNFFPQSLWTKLHALMFYLKSPREPKYAFYCIKKTETLGKFAVGLIQEACVAF